MIERLAGQLMEKFGAPDAEAARLAAEEEIAFELAVRHPPQTLLAVQRSVETANPRALSLPQPRHSAAEMRSVARRCQRLYVP